jgi:hypothetical protein
MPSSSASSSSYASSSSSGSSSSSRSSSSHRHSRHSTSSHDSDWTVSYAKLAKRQSLGVRFMGYAAGRPSRATALVKKVRDGPDNRSVYSFTTAGSSYAHEPETRMYWVKDHGGPGSFIMHGGASRAESGSGPYGGAPPHHAHPYGVPPMHPRSHPGPPPMRPPPPPADHMFTPTPMAPAGMAMPPRASPATMSVPGVKVAGPPRRSPPAGSMLPGFSVPVATTRMNLG